MPLTRKPDIVNALFNMTCMQLQIRISVGRCRIWVSDSDLRSCHLQPDLRLLATILPDTLRSFPPSHPRPLWGPLRHTGLPESRASSYSLGSVVSTFSSPEHICHSRGIADSASASCTTNNSTYEVFACPANRPHTTGSLGRSWRNPSPLPHQRNTGVSTAGLHVEGRQAFMCNPEGSCTFAQRLLKRTVDRYLSPNDGKTTTISLPLFSGLWATLCSEQETTSAARPCL